MLTSFLFVEILDRPAIHMLNELRAIFRGRTSRSGIHITVRGPYKNPPSAKVVDKLWQQISGERLLLHGIGRFELPEKHIVFLRSHSRAIRRIWWKRDYPILRYGFNPHITLFEGPPDQAREVETFLKREQIELFCRRLALTLYQTHPGDLFDTPLVTELFSTGNADGGPLVNQYRFDPAILIRARALMERLVSTQLAIPQ